MLRYTALRTAAAALRPVASAWSRCSSSFLADYDAHVAERAAAGIVPLPLDAELYVVANIFVTEHQCEAKCSKGCTGPAESTGDTQFEAHSSCPFTMWFSGILLKRLFKSIPAPQL